MTDAHDALDARILQFLQEDARNNTNAEIGERTGVSASTVGNRIRRLEESGIVGGYHPDIDYARAGFPLHVLFVCTVPITDREAVVEEITNLPGVIKVRELMTGDRNVHVEMVCEDAADITRLATAIDALGVQVNEEVLVKQDLQLPANVFGAEPGDEP